MWNISCITHSYRCQQKGGGSSRETMLTQTPPFQRFIMLKALLRNVVLVNNSVIYFLIWKSILIVCYGNHKFQTFPTVVGWFSREFFKQTTDPSEDMQFFPNFLFKNRKKKVGWFYFRVPIFNQNWLISS